MPFTFQDAAEIVSRPARHCEKCGASSADVQLDTYNENDDGTGGNLICDPCIYAAAKAADPGARSYVMPPRPEGYYHCAPGTFD